MNINATLLGQAISFLLFVWFCMKFVWPPIIGAIEERQKKIAEGLESAERADKSLELAQQDVSKQLKEAKVQAAKIVESAEKLRAKIVDDAKDEAITERDRIIAQGQTEIEAEKNRVKEDLRKQVSILAIACAEKLIEKSISEDDNVNAKIIEKFVAEL